MSMVNFNACENKNESTKCTGRYKTGQLDPCEQQQQKNNVHNNGSLSRFFHTERLRLQLFSSMFFL